MSTPSRIPVKVEIQNGVASGGDFLFDGADNAPSQPQVDTRIVLTSPERPPITGLVQVSVSYDNSRPRGVGVNISGAMGADLNVDALEEVCRRGGAFGLPGRVWAKAHALA